ncbi:MAG: polysaccharide biosynthesis C-terminal domain-containing protein [Clostridia bacterium]|nr:polysaccharide biosynthesis C-terminal domain-containing protein [Clostridia bacterium]
MTNAKKLLFNTLLLTAAAFLTRTAAVSFNAYLSGQLGAQGIGLLQLITSVYSMAVVFACGGSRLAAMRLTADCRALQRGAERRVMRRCLVYSLICGTAAAAALALSSELIGSAFIDDPRSAPSLRILSLGLPFIAMSSALNGYFTSVGRLAGFTAAGLAEQAFRIALTVFSLRAAVAHGLEAACVAISFGMTASEAFSLVCTLIIYRLSVENGSAHASPVMKKLLSIALPDVLGSGVRSVLMTVEHLLIPAGLRKSGSDAEQSFTAYGTIHGMSLPLVLYPSALLASLSGLLIPEISSAHTRGNTLRINYMISRVLHLTLLFSIGAAGIMYSCAERLGSAVYPGTSAAVYLQIFAPLIPVMYTDMTVDGILKGLGQQVSCMKYNIADAGISVLLVWLLVPRYSVRGYVAVVFVSEIINFALSFHRLTQVSEVRLSLFEDILIPIVCAFCSGAAVNILFTLSDPGLGIKTEAASQIILCAAVYVLLLAPFGSLGREELIWMKKLLASGKK